MPELTISKAVLVPIRHTEGDGGYSFGVIGLVGGYPEHVTGVVAEVDSGGAVTFRLAREGETAWDSNGEED